MIDFNLFKNSDAKKEIKSFLKAADFGIEGLDYQEAINEISEELRHFSEERDILIPPSLAILLGSGLIMRKRYKE